MSLIETHEQQGPLCISVRCIVALWSGKPDGSDAETLLQLANAAGPRRLNESYPSVKAKVSVAGGRFIETTVDGLRRYINVDAIATIRCQGTEWTAIGLRDGREYVAQEAVAALTAKVAGA